MKKMKLFLLSASAAALLLTGCATTGVKIDPARLDAMKVGVTTPAEAIAMFGPPTVETTAGDGAVTLQYTYAEAQVRASTFIPIVGMFAGGTDVKASSVNMSFDRAGKLLAVSKSVSQQATGMGLSKP